MVSYRSRFVLAAFLATGWSGCFLDTGTINKRPVVHIDDHAPLHRGETVTFTATITDPNDKLDALTVEWRVGDTCPDARSGAALTCEEKSSCSYTLPAQTQESLCVVVRVTDSYSATNETEHNFRIVNRAPQAIIDQIAPAKIQEHYQLLTDFEFSASRSKDLDLGDQDSLVYTWAVTHNGQELSVPGCRDASKPDSCFFTVEDPGSYQVALTVKDPSQAVSTPATIDLVVEKDSPPCIRSYSPPVLDYPVMFASQTNTFAVIKVEDDVNPFPAGTGENPSHKTAGKFIWSSRSNLLDEFTRSTHKSNQFPFLEGSFNVGDQIQIRVAYQDDNHSLAACDPNATVCSLGQDDCVQWITWTVIFQ